MLIDEKEIRCLHPWKLGRAKTQDCSEAVLAGFFGSSSCWFLRKQSLPVSTEVILAGFSEAVQRFFGSSPCQFLGSSPKVLRKQSLSVYMAAVLAGFYGSSPCGFLESCPKVVRVRLWSQGFVYPPSNDVTPRSCCGHPNDVKSEITV